MEKIESNTNLPPESTKNLQEETGDFLLGNPDPEMERSLNLLKNKGYTKDEAGLVLRHKITDKSGKNVSFMEIEEKYCPFFSIKFTPSKFARAWLLSKDLDTLSTIVGAMKSLEATTFSFFEDFEKTNLTDLLNVTNTLTENISAKDLILILNSKDPEKKLNFINQMQRKNVPTQEIIRLARVTLDPEIAMRIKNFNDKYSLGFFLNNINNYRTLLPIIEHLESLCENEKDMEFIRYLLRSKEYNFGSALNKRFDLKELTKDLSLKWCIKIYEKISNPELALRIGRTLYLNGDYDYQQIVKMDIPEIEKVYNEIKNTLEENSRLKVFRNRNVLVLRHTEPLDDGTNRFINPSEVAKLNTTCGDNFEIMEIDPKPQPYLEKERILNKILQTPPPMTFIFAGHGLKDRLLLNETLHGTITDAELAETIDKRADLYADNHELLSKDIYIFDSCYNHTFIRNLYGKIRNKNILPITSGPSEIGEAAYDIGQTNLETVYDISNPDLTIGDIANNEDKTNQNTNLSLFIPKKGKPIQIVEADSKENPST